MASNATDPDESLHLQVRRLSGEVERLRKAAEDWHDAAVRAERNAAMSQEETLAHIDRLAALMDKDARQQAEIKTLRNQAVSNAEDAERYRWLRTFATWVNEDYESIHYRWNADEFESVDAAIDAAMRGGK